MGALSKYVASRELWPRLIFLAKQLVPSGIYARTSPDLLLNPDSHVELFGGQGHWKMQLTTHTSHAK